MGQRELAEALMTVLRTFQNYCDPDLEELITRYEKSGDYLRLDRKRPKFKITLRQPLLHPPVTQFSEISGENQRHYARLRQSEGKWHLHLASQLEPSLEPVLVLKQHTRAVDIQSNPLLVMDQLTKKEQKIFRRCKNLNF